MALSSRSYSGAGDAISLLRAAQRGAGKAGLDAEVDAKLAQAVANTQVSEAHSGSRP